MFDLLTKIIHDEKHYYAFDQIEHVKNQLLEKKISIEQIEHGAGSRNNHSKKKPIKQLIKEVSMPKKQGEWLFKLVQHFQPKNILELGTCIGISTLYVGLENKNRKIITLEGNPASAQIARQIFSQLTLNEIEIIEGTFENTIEIALQKLQQVDFAFVDGNHRYEPTIQYFKQILPFINQNSVLIFHDIHWSAEMEKAWNELRNNEQVSISIDLFYFGILFFRKGILKQHFVLK